MFATKILYYKAIKGSAAVPRVRSFSSLVKSFSLECSVKHHIRTLYLLLNMHPSFLLIKDFKQISWQRYSTVLYEYVMKYRNSSNPTTINPQAFLMSSRVEKTDYYYTMILFELWDILTTAEVFSVLRFTRVKEYSSNFFIMSIFVT